MQLKRVCQRLPLPLALLLAVSFLLVCPAETGGWTSSHAAVQELSDTLRIGFLQRVDSLNPYLGLNDASRVFYGLVYDTLTSIGNDLETVPNLAKEWWAVPTTDPEMQNTGAPFGSVWQYNLTTDALWTDGKHFTADDVVWNIRLNALNYDELWRYQPYSNFMKDAVKVNESTVRVYFYNRDSGTLMPTSFAYLASIPMLPKHMLQNENAYSIGFNWSGVFEGTNIPIVGTGPFMAKPDIRSEWLAGDHITLLRKPNCHWGADYGKYVQFNEIVMYFYDDPTIMSSALRDNQIDIASFPPQAYRTIKNGVASGSFRNVTTFDGPKITQDRTEIGVNMGGGGTNPSRLDRTIREAMAMATNKTYIVENFYLGMAEEGSTLIGPINQFWHYEPNATEKFSFDIAAANALLENAGYRDGPDADTIRECTATSYAVTAGLVPEGTPLKYEMLLRREYREERDIAMYLESQWSQLGIDINYMIVDESTLSAIVYAYAYDTMIWDWSADIDPNYQLFAQSKRAWNGWSDNQYQNESYEENYTKSVNTLGRDQRKGYVDNCLKIHYLDAAYIILAYPQQTYARRTDTFTGWGDWAADPGRSLENYWTGNPLFFDLRPAGLDLVTREHAGDFRIPLPEAWTVEENATIEGEELDLVATGPIHNDFAINILVTSEKHRSVSESTSYLFSLMNDTIDELETEGVNVSADGDPSFWETTNYSAIGFFISWINPHITQYIALYASEKHDRVWIVVCTADVDAYPMLQPTFQSVTTGFEVIRTPDSLLRTLTIYALGATVAIAAAVATGVIFLKRRKTSLSSAMPAQTASSGQTAQPPGFCSFCGQAQSYTNSVCARCGKSLPSPPFGRKNMSPPT